MDANKLDWTRRLTWLAAAIAAAVVAACGGGGGGGDMASVPAAADKATALSAGPISGFGSVIVNGVRFDDSGAQVQDEDGARALTGDMRLGMMVEIDGRQVDAAKGTGTALRIRMGGKVLGPVDSVDAPAGTLVVLGQPVDTTAQTVFGDGVASGLASLAVGTVVAVHGIFDASTGHTIATRLQAAPNAPAFRVRGPLSGLDSAARTFRIGGASVSYAAITPAPDLSGGDFARCTVARLDKAAVAGVWQAQAVRSCALKVDEGIVAHLRGAVTAFNSSSDFEVNGVKVNAATATFPDGAAGITVGTRVEVEGTMSNGVLVAARVEIDDERHGQERHPFELHGLVESLNTAAKTFVVRGVTVAYGSASFDNGSAADLADGKRVEVKGKPSADRTQLNASIVKFES